MTSCATRSPRVDILELPDAWHLVLETPGVEESAVDITVEQGVLHLKATRSVEAPEGFQSVYAEAVPRPYQRSFRLPEDVLAESISAELRGGILRVILPKRPAVVPVRIAVRST
jgi:HSP20 family protein